MDLGPLLAGLDGGIKGRLDAIPQLEAAASAGDLAVRTHAPQLTLLPPRPRLLASDSAGLSLCDAPIALCAPRSRRTTAR